TADAGTDLQSFPQRLDDAGGAALLQETQNGVDDEQRAHEDHVRILSEHCGKHHDQLEHPRRESPELAKEAEERVLLLLRHFVVATLRAAALHVGAREPRVGIHVHRHGRVSPHVQFRISGMSSPCRSMYCLCSTNFSLSRCFSVIPASPVCGRRSIVSITRWNRSRSFSTVMSNGVVMVPSSL